MSVTTAPETLDTLSPALPPAVPEMAPDRFTVPDRFPDNHAQRVDDYLRDFEKRAVPEFDRVWDTREIARESQATAVQAFVRENTPETYAAKTEAVNTFVSLTEEYDAGPERIALGIALDEVSVTRETYANQLAMRKRQTSPIALLAMGRTPAGTEKSPLSTPGFSKWLPFINTNTSTLEAKSGDTLVRAEQDFLATIDAATELYRIDYVKQRPDTDEEDVDQQIATFRTRLLTGEIDADDDHSGQLERLNNDIEKNRLLSSGHYKLDADGNLDIKGGRFTRHYHKYVSKSLQGWHNLKERKGGKAVRAATVGAIGALATIGAVSTLPVVAAGVAVLGTRVIKSGGSLLVDHKGGQIAQAKAEADTNRAVLKTLRTRVEKDETLDTSFLATFLERQYSDPAKKESRQNMQRAGIAIVTFAGGAALGEIAHYFASGLGGSATANGRAHLPTRPGSVSPTSGVNHETPTALPTEHPAHSPAAPHFGDTTTRPSHTGTHSGNTGKEPKPEVNVTARTITFSGNSVTQELQESAAQQGYDLDAAKSYDAYKFLVSHHDGSLTNMFQTTDGKAAGYLLPNGDVGIAPQQGTLLWNIHDQQNFQAFLANHPELSDLADADKVSN